MALMLTFSVYTVQEDGSLDSLSRTPESTAPKFKVRLFHKNPSSESDCHYDSVVMTKDAFAAKKINVSVPPRSSERTKKMKSNTGD